MAEFAQVIGRPVPTISIVDVGAMVEGDERSAPLVQAGCATVTGFEPNPEEFARLQARGGPYRYVQAFLGDGKPGTFHLTRYPGCSSLLEPDPSVIDLFQTIAAAHPGGNFHVDTRHPVQTTRMDDLAGLDVDYLKIDVQGAELDILRHATTKLARTLVIEAEVEFLPLYRDQPLFGDVQCFLRDHGFVLHKLIDVVGRPLRPLVPQNPFVPMSQMLWADAVFVRDFTRLDGYDDDGLLKAAAILDMAYNSYDLAALLLAEHDRRTGGTTGKAYLDSLPKRRLVVKCLNVKAQP